MRHHAEARQHLLYPDEHLLRLTRQSPEKPYLKQIKHRRFETYSYYQVAESAQKLVSALTDLGLKPQDKIAIIAKNCAEWFICDFACMLGNFISVPIFPTAQADTIEYCLLHSEVKLMFIGKLDSADQVTQVQQKLPHIRSVALPYDSVPACDDQFQSLMERYTPADIIPSHQNQDIMSIVYTSGTSGMPKGTIITYGAFSWSVNQITNLVNIKQRDRLLSYLPLSHITERVYIFGVSIEIGVETAFPESRDTFIEDIKMHRPTLFISVPRLWTLFHQHILNVIPQRTLSVLLYTPFVSRFIKRRIAEELGLNKARVLGCGSAPVSQALLKWYDKVGLPLTEGWGMTESTAVGTLNYPYRRSKLGTAGMPLPGIELKLATDGEILMRGKCLFEGYYKNDQDYWDTLTNHGWFKTGDIGQIDKHGYLTITGRTKDTFKTAKGKFVAPSAIEKAFISRCKTEMTCLIGSGLPGPILLVVPYQFHSLDKARYEHSITKAMTAVNSQLLSHEKIKGILIIQTPWNIEHGELTPTLKIKRHVLEQRYHELGENWPQGQTIIWEASQ